MVFLIMSPGFVFVILSYSYSYIQRKAVLPPKWLYLRAAKLALAHIVKKLKLLIIFLIPGGWEYNDNIKK